LRLCAACVGLVVLDPGRRGINGFFTWIAILPIAGGIGKFTWHSVAVLKSLSLNDAES
jgi:hypothetical protein